MAAALVDQNEISSLHLEQDQLIALLKNKVDSWRIKLVRMAAIYKRLMELGDPELDVDMSVSQISTYMTRLLRRHNVAIADHVSDYLPDEYKNPNLARDYLNEKGPVTWGGIDPALLIDELSHLPAEHIKKLPSNVKILLYDTIMKDKNLIESDALEQHYQLNDKKQRETIKTPRPFKPRITEYSKAIHYHAEVLLEWEQNVINRCPPPPEKEEEFAAGEQAAAEIYENFNNEKHSLALGEWLERDQYRVHQSKHGAAVKDKVDTLLCNKCSFLKRAEYQPGDFVEVEWHWESPHNWRCPVCGEEEDFVKRPLTREQCGDKGHERCPNCDYKFNWDVGLSPMDTQAIQLVNDLPGYYNSLKYYNQFMQKCVGTRKVELGVDLSAKS